MRSIRLGFLALGAALLVVLIVENDPGAILASMSQLSWRLLIVLCFPMPLVALFDTLGWRSAFPRHRVAFRTLLSVRLAGEAFNITTPTAALGGEAVKAWLLRDRVPLDESLPSLIVAKTTITIAQGVFLLLGVTLAHWTLPPDSLLLRGMQALLVVEVVALTGFVLAQMRGVLGWGGRLLSGFGFGLPRFFEARGTLERVDDGLARFYRHERGRFIASILWHLVAWLLGSVETYLILRFIGVGVSLTTATVIEAFGAAVRVATFLIPASLGALEGGFVATFVALGLGPTAGVSFSLVRRVREATWAGVGLVAFAARARSQARGHRPASAH